MHADNEAAFERDYRTIARKLGIDNKLGGEELLLKVCDCIESQPRWLLILDNADDLTLFGVGDTLDAAKSLAKYLPQGHGGSLLWTSRDKQIVALAGVRRGVEVSQMSAGEAKMLLAVTRDGDIRNEEVYDAQLLLKELQWLPLAISQAGFYLRRTSTPVKKYLSKLLKDKSRWDTLKHTEHDRHRRPGVPNSVLETWDISVKHIEQESQPAYTILHVIAYFDNQNIPLSLIQAIFTMKNDFLTQEALCEESQATLDIAIVRLKEFSLISQRKTENGEPSFDMHKLTHEAIRYRLNRQDICSRAYFLCIAASTIQVLFAKIEQETWPLCEKYATHAIRLIDWAEAPEAEVLTNGVKPYGLVASGLIRVMQYFCDRGLWSKSTFLMEKLLSIEHKRIGEEDPRTINLTSELSIMYMYQGLYNEAEKFGLRALALSKKVHGEKDLTTITMMRCLAEVYSKRGQFKDVEKLRGKAFLLLREVRGEKHVDTIQAMEDLEIMYEERNQIDIAVKIKLKVLLLRYEALGEKNGATIYAEQNIVKKLMYQREWKKAEKLQIRLLSKMKMQATGMQATGMQETGMQETGMQETCWRTYADIINAMMYLCTIYHYQRKYAKSREIRSKILLLQQAFWGKNHPDTIAAMMNLASAYCDEGKLILAERLQRKSLSLFHKVLGERHVTTITAMVQAAPIFRQRGLFKKADKLEKRAIFLRNKFYNEMLPPGLSCIDEIAAKRSEETPISHGIVAVTRHKRVASTRRGTKATMRRKMAAYTGHKTAAFTRRGKRVSTGRKIVSVLRRRMARKRKYRQ